MLVGVDLGVPHFDRELIELGLLAETAGMRPVARLACKRPAPDAALFVGSGKVEEIRLLAQAEGAHEVLFDQALSPVQQRNLERAIGLPVNDRTLLILEIFAQRARSHEGKLQVELARLQYLSTRLVRRWSHLERQQGGIGGRGGPGETQIELDRRMIGEAIKRTKERLTKVKRQRQTQRRRRERRETFNISLVGYTNAGKSSLFNALVEAFEATLQEAADADLLLHVVDAANPAFPEQMAEVQRVLREIGAEQVPQLLVFNKLDALDAARRPQALHDVMDVDGQAQARVFVSARTGEGLALLRQALAERVQAAAQAKTPAGEAPGAIGHNAWLDSREIDE